MAGPASALSLDGRTAVVLGGTSGIGRAISLGLAAAGADVVASARRAAEVADTADAIEAAGRKTLRLTADVTKRDTLEALRDATLAAFAKVDILVNCAGKTKRLPAMDYDEATWNDILDVNLTGTLRGCQVFGKPMLERGFGAVRGEQGGGGGPDEVAGRRMGPARGDGERDRARRVPDGAECRAAGRNRARA